MGGKEGCKARAPTRLEDLLSISTETLSPHHLQVQLVESSAIGQHGDVLYGIHRAVETHPKGSQGSLEEDMHYKSYSTISSRLM